MEQTTSAWPSSTLSAAVQSSSSLKNSPTTSAVSAAAAFSAELYKSSVKNLFSNYSNNIFSEENDTNKNNDEIEQEQRIKTETEIKKLYNQIQIINNKSVNNCNYLQQPFLKQCNDSLKNQNVEIDEASTSLLSAAVVHAYNNYQLQQQKQQQPIEEPDVSLSENLVAKTQRLSEYLLQKKNLDTLNNDQSPNKQSNHKRHMNVFFFF